MAARLHLRSCHRLGFCKRMDGRKNAALGEHPAHAILAASGTESKDQEKGGLAYLPSHLFNPAEGKRGRRKGRSGIDAPCKFPDHDERVYQSHYDRKARRAEPSRGRAMNRTASVKEGSVEAAA